MKVTEYTEIYNTERLCLMCRHVCPVGRLTKREATTPHGWTLLVASVQRGLTEWDEEAVDTLYQCADCGLCQAEHPTDRPIPAAIVAARAWVVEEGKMPESVRELDEKLRLWGNPYQQIHEEVAAGQSGGIGLLVSAANYVERPATVGAAQALLRAAGVEHSLLSTGRTGVYLPYTVGLWETARDLARQTLEEVRSAGIKEVITLSKEDAHAFQHVYQEIGVEFPDDMRVIEFSEWLLRMIKGGRLEVAQREMEGVIYHDPCHTARQPEGSDAARKIVEALTGSAPGEMFWRGKSATPCGAIGGFQWTQPRLAEALARQRIEEARSRGAQVLVTDDPQCAAHLAKYAEGLPVMSLVELVAESVKRE